MNLETILERLHGVRKSGAGWSARCPAHEDKRNSLSISKGDDGRVLLKCFAGCNVEAICKSLGLNPSDLFPHANGEGQQKRKVVSIYNYTDERGKLLFQNLRYEPKDFRQRRPNGKGWSWKLGDVRRVPYRLPEITSADFVLVVEGEKDADSARRLGLAATSSKHWQPDFCEFVRGKNVAVIADADEAGRKIAGQVASALVGKVRSLKLFELPGAKDLTDWVEAGGTREALDGFIELQPQWKPGMDIAGMFHTYADFENAPPLSFAIKDFLQNDAATLFGGLSGHGKTLVMLSTAKALLAGEGARLWDYFEVQERAERVVYLIPESSIGPFKHRLKLFGLYDYVRDGRLLVRTLSMGPTPSLSDPRILAAAKGAHVALDTAVRFATDGDENSAGDNQRGLATDIFALLNAGARTIFGAHHAPKTFATQTVMTLENVLRGTGDIGAMLATAWGMKQLDPAQNIIHFENVKPRDFEPPGPFQLIGRPHIDTEGDFKMYKPPSECGRLADEIPGPRNNSGASVDAREEKAAKMALLRRLDAEEPNRPWEQIVTIFKQEGLDIARATIRKYRSEMNR